MEEKKKRFWGFGETGENDSPGIGIWKDPAAVQSLGAALTI